MVCQNATIRNETGIHARPASLIVQKAGQYKAQVELEYGQKKVNAKSIMGVMSLGVNQSKKITVMAEGEDAQKAVDEIIKLIENGFGE
ncbi:MAG: HPr family phosphocarrier protein [Bacillota bacterium]